MLTGVLDILAYRRDSTWRADVSVNVRSKTDGDFGIGDVNFSLGPSMRFNYGDTAPFSGRSSQILGGGRRICPFQGDGVRYGRCENGERDGTHHIYSSIQT